MRALTLTRLDAKGEKGVQPLTAAEDEQARINADATRRAWKVIRKTTRWALTRRVHGHACVSRSFSHVFPAYT
jgi:hypothetical protein